MLDFMECELTDHCDLECVHCLTESGPLVGHGPMLGDQWIDAIDQGLGLGLKRVQLIGGEPTSHPDFRRILDHTVDSGLTVSVFTNLTHIPNALWPALTRPGVTICTSYYSDDPERHDQVTTRTGSHAKTRANVVKAVDQGIRVTAALTTIHEGQRVEEAKAELVALGVEEVRIDGVREVGRGGWGCDVNELCGNCGLGRLAILPDGVVVPCVLGRWLKAGNVMVTPLAEILEGPAWNNALVKIPRPPRPRYQAEADRMQKAKEKLHAHL